jgi:UDP-N-acetylglucosamine--N-acetylmuramyl-(pentapeptide) pyrophosphoryl-undecaprenol N-acetylglucosamine transferase
LRIVQQARPEDEDALRDAYAQMGINAKVASFFTDLAKRMSDAHMVISRSGASTVSEIAVIGRPAILVPYPFALDHDQAANAAALAASGGAEVYPQSGLSAEKLAEAIAELMDNPERAREIAKSAKSAGKPDAARLLADLAEAIAARKPQTSIREGSRQ